MSAKTVLVVTSDVPFVHGGHRVIAEELVRALRESGHRAELVRTPSNRFGRTLEAYAANWLTDVGVTGYGDPVDHVISLRYPAYAVRHTNHTAWVIHRMREYYDLWPHLIEHLSPLQRFKEEVRRGIIHKLDRYLLTENTRRVFCISNTVRERLHRWGNIPATTLYPPTPQRPWRTTAYEPFVFAISRLHRWKRMHLLVEAAVVTPDLRAVIAGVGPEQSALQSLIDHHRIGDRVRLVGTVSDEELVDWYARAGAVFFAPVNEDYGFITVESFLARKPVVTCSDSGAVCELVTDGETGVVTPPDPAAIGHALSALLAEPRRAEKLGENGHALASGMSWERAVATLLLENE